MIFESYEHILKTENNLSVKPIYARILPVVVSKLCKKDGKQFRPWSEAACCGVWSGSRLFTQASQSQNLD